MFPVKHVALAMLGLWLMCSAVQYVTSAWSSHALITTMTTSTTPKIVSKRTPTTTIRPTKPQSPLRIHALCRARDEAAKLAEGAERSVKAKGQRWHTPAKRCGAQFPLDGRPSECDPLSEHYCCNHKLGWCGSTNDHCNAPSSVNYAKGFEFNARRSLPALNYFCNPASPHIDKLLALGLRTYHTEPALLKVIQNTRLAHEKLGGKAVLIFSSFQDLRTMSLVVPEQRDKDVYRLRQHTLKEGEAVLDVGGHVGVAALHEAIVNPGHKVFTMEPSPDNYFYLCWNVAANHADSITAIHGGLSADGSQMTFSVANGDSTGGSLFNSPGNPALTGINVQTYTLEMLQEEYAELKHIGFLKLDCEGCEFVVVPHWSEAQWKTMRRVAGEVHPWFSGARAGNWALMKTRLCASPQSSMENCDQLV